MKLTLRQQRFCEFHVLSGNGSDAARRAGYSEKTARQMASENLTKPAIQAAIQALQQAYAEKLELTRQDVIQAILGAIQAATEQGAPATMIRGWVELAKIAGLDKPDPAESRRNKPLSPGAQRVKSRIENMSTSELLEIVAAKEETAE